MLTACVSKVNAQRCEALKEEAKAADREYVAAFGDKLGEYLGKDVGYSKVTPGGVYFNHSPSAALRDVAVSKGMVAQINREKNDEKLSPQARQAANGLTYQILSSDELTLEDKALLLGELRNDLRAINGIKREGAGPFGTYGLAVEGNLIQSGGNLRAYLQTSGSLKERFGAALDGAGGAGTVATAAVGGAAEHVTKVALGKAAVAIGAISKKLSGPVGNNASKIDSPLTPSKGKSGIMAGAVSDVKLDARVEDIDFVTAKGGKYEDHFLRVDNEVYPQKSTMINVSGGVSGGHQMDEFEKFARANNISYTKHPMTDTSGKVIPGLYEVKYRVPQVDSRLEIKRDPSTGEILYKGNLAEPKTKTVFDPEIISPTTMITYAKRAAAIDFNNQSAHMMKTGLDRKIYSQEYRGISFKIYLGKDSSGRVVVHNVHPINPNESGR